MPTVSSIRIRNCMFYMAIAIVILLPGTAMAQGVPPNLASMTRDLFTQSKAELKKSTGDPVQDEIRRRARDIFRQAGVRYWAKQNIQATQAENLPRNHTLAVGDNDDQLAINWDPDRNRFNIRIKANETSEGKDDGFSLMLGGNVSTASSADGKEKLLRLQPDEDLVSVFTDEEVRRLKKNIFGTWRRTSNGDVWEISDSGPKKGVPPPVPNKNVNPKKDKDVDDKESPVPQAGDEAVVDPFNKQGPTITKSLADLYQDYVDNSESGFEQAQDAIHGKKQPAEETYGYRTLSGLRGRIDDQIKSLEDQYSTSLDYILPDIDALKKAFKDIKQMPKKLKFKQEQKVIEKALKNEFGKLDEQQKKTLEKFRSLIDWINRLQDASARLKDMQKLLEDTGSIYPPTAQPPNDNENIKQAAEDPEARIARLENEIEKLKTNLVFKWKNTETGEIVRQTKFRKLKEPFEYLGQGLREPGGEDKIVRLQEKIKQIRAENIPTSPVDKYDPVNAKKLRASGKAKSLNIRVTDKNGRSWDYESVLMQGGRITASRTLRSAKDITNLPQSVTRSLIASWSPPEWIELEAKFDYPSKSLKLIGKWWRLKVTYSNGMFDLEQTISRIHTPWSRSLVLERDNSGTLVFLHEVNGELMEIKGDLPYGAPIFLEVRFKNPQRDSSKSALLSWKGSQVEIGVEQLLEDNRKYRSAAFVLDLPPEFRAE